jgi:hypothetical protein
VDRGGTVGDRAAGAGLPEVLQGDGGETAMIPIEYLCEGPVTIRRCPRGVFAWGIFPEYWYLRRPMHTMDAPEIGWTKERIQDFKHRGFEVAYWTGDEWANCTPKQFPTPEAAYEEWEAKIKEVTKCQ